MAKPRERKSACRSIVCGNILRLIILLGIAGTASIHVAVVVLPNWWKLDITMIEPQDHFTGVNRLSGGLWRMCQYYAEDGARYLDESRTKSCYYYGQDENVQHEVGEVGHVENTHVFKVRGCMISSLCLNLFSAILVAVSCKLDYKKCPMILACLIQISQCLLIAGGIVAAHKWIGAGTYTDFNENDFVFYWACFIIAPYFALSLMSLWSACTTNTTAGTVHRESDDDSLESDVHPGHSKPIDLGDIGEPSQPYGYHDETSQPQGYHVEPSQGYHDEPSQAYHDEPSQPQGYHGAKPQQPPMMLGNIDSAEV